jgi:hypothetical protein
MKIGVKDHIESGGKSRIENLRSVLTGLQNFYLEELEKTKKRLENVKRVIETPDFNSHKKS